jgi:hypothetical protein
MPDQSDEREEPDEKNLERLAAARRELDAEVRLEPGHSKGDSTSPSARAAPPATTTLSGLPSGMRWRAASG